MSDENITPAPETATPTTETPAVVDLGVVQGVPPSESTGAVTTPLFTEIGTTGVGQPVIVGNIKSPGSESEPVATDPTLGHQEVPATVITPTTEPSEPAPTTSPTESSTTESELTEATTSASIGDTVGAEVDAAIEQATTAAETKAEAEIAHIGADAEAKTAAAVAEAVRATSTLLVHGDTLAEKVEASLAQAQSGLTTLKTSSVNPIVSSAVEKFEAHIKEMWDALTHFKASTGKN